MCAQWCEPTVEGYERTNRIEPQLGVAWYGVAWRGVVNQLVTFIISLTLRSHLISCTFG